MANPLTFSRSHRLPFSSTKVTAATSGAGENTMMSTSMDRLYAEGGTKDDQEVKAGRCFLDPFCD